MNTERTLFGLAAEFATHEQLLDALTTDPGALTAATA